MNTIYLDILSIENEKEGLETIETAVNTFTIDTDIYTCNLDFSKSESGDVNTVIVSPIDNSTSTEDDYLSTIYSALDLKGERFLRIYVKNEQFENVVLLNSIKINTVRYNMSLADNTYNSANLIFNLSLAS